MRCTFTVSLSSSSVRFFLHFGAAKPIKSLSEFIVPALPIAPKVLDITVLGNSGSRPLDILPCNIFQKATKLESMEPKKEPYKVQIPLSSKGQEYLLKKDQTIVYILVPLAQTYLKALDQLRSAWTEEEPKESSALIPFVVTCAAALECHYIILLSDYIYGLDTNNKYAKAFMSTTLRAKLDTIIPLLTDSKYIIKPESPTYQHLAHLIKVRNKLMHGKSFAVRNDVSIHHDESGSIEFSTIPVPKLPHDDLQMGDCDNFYLALKKLDDVLSSHERWKNDEELQPDFQDLLAPVPRREDSGRKL